MLPQGTRWSRGRHAGRKSIARTARGASDMPRHTARSTAVQVKDKGATSKPRLLSPGPETRRDSDEQATPPLSRTRLNGHDRTGTRTWTRRPQGANENEQATPPLSRASAETTATSRPRLLSPGQALYSHDRAREPGRGHERAAPRAPRRERAGHASSLPGRRFHEDSDEQATPPLSRASALRPRPRTGTRT